MTGRLGGTRVVLAAAVLAAAGIAGCDYVVVPPERDGGTATGEGWAAVATGVETTAAGDLVVDLAIRNDTGLWSTMAADSAELRGPGGTTSCETVTVGTGGHRVAPGLQVRGYQSGTKQEVVTEPIRVTCGGATADAGSTLVVDYEYATGDYDYYDPRASTSNATLEVPLDSLVTDLVFPVAEPVDGLVQAPDATIDAINGMTVTLVDARRTPTGIELDWQATNPGEYPSSVHIGTPPAVGADGIIYGRWESPDLASVPVVPPGESATWTTSLELPADTTNLYLLLSVETGKQRHFANHLLDLTGV